MRSIRTLLAVLVASTVGASGARAAAVPAWSAPATFVPADGAGNCLRGAGTDRLALGGALTATTAATDLLTVTPGAEPRLALDATATLGWLIECADVAVPVGDAAADVAPLLAAPVHVPARGTEVRVGAAGAAPVTLRRGASGHVLTAVRVAVAADGTAVVTWVERSADLSSRAPTARLMAAVRPRADAAFGPARTVDDQLHYRVVAPPLLGIDAAGRATLVWQGGAAADPWIRAAQTEPDGGLGRPQRVVRAPDSGRATLAVAPDGRALLVADGWAGRGLFERLPGSRRFVPVPGVGELLANEVAIALGRDGAALVATRENPDGVTALHRAAGARRFSAWQRLAGRPALGVSFMEFDSIPGVGDRPWPTDELLDATLGAALDAEGRALVTWARTATRWRAAAPVVARSDTAGRFARPVRLGTRCRAATAVRPLPLAGGGLGVAWTDVGRLREGSAEGLFENPIGFGTAADGRLNVAVPEVAPAEGPAAASPAATQTALAETATASPAAAQTATAAPRVTAAVVGRRALRVGESLRVRVRCPRDGAPCAVRGVVDATMVERRDGRPARDGHGEQLSDATPLAPGATTVLRLDPSPGMRVAPLGRGRVRVALTSCAPSGTAFARSTLRPRLRGLPRTPAPRLVVVRAVRRDGAVRVTGRLSRSVPGAHVLLYGTPDGTAIVRDLGDRTRFAATFDGRDASRLRTVSVHLDSQEHWTADRARVRIVDRP